MTDTNLLEMLDDVDLSIEESHAVQAKAIAGYVNGRYENWPAIVAKYGSSDKHLLSVDTQGNPSAGAQTLDCERFDATLDQAAQWVKETRKAGMHYRDLRWFPKVYVQASNAVELCEKMTAAGVARDDWRLWTAHWGWSGGAHVCGPDTCGLLVQADATQWTSTFDGVSLDASLCYPRFFDGPLPEHPPVVEVEVPRVVGLAVAEAVEVLKVAGFEVPSSPPADYVVTAQAPKDGVRVVKGARVILMGEASKPVESPKPVPPVVVPPEPVKPPEPIVEPPKPMPVPEPAKPTLLVYVREVLTKEAGQKVGLPEGTILFIPHTVTSEADVK